MGMGCLPFQQFVKSVRIVTFKDVNVEEVQKTDIDIPDDIH